MAIHMDDLRHHPHVRQFGRAVAIVILVLLLVVLFIVVTDREASGAAGCSRTGCGSGWSIVPSPSPGTAQNLLFAVTAASSGALWAVGDRVSPESAQTIAPLAEHWDGTALTGWTILRKYQTLLHGVFVPAPTVAWAVGHFVIDLDETLPVIDRYDGTTWAPFPKPRLLNGVLSGIAGASGTDIWAVGRQFVQGEAQTIVEHFDGAAWARVPSPSPESTYLDFGAIAVLAPDDVWAAGDFQDSNLDFRTLIEHYDGTAWTIVPSPNVGSGDNHLSGLAALGPRNVWAVGRAFDGTRFRPIALHWNGTAWRARLLPVAGTGDHTLNGLAAGPGQTMWAVGSFTDPSGVQRTLTERYSGGVWRVVASPNASEDDNVLNGVAFTTDGDVWAVGSSNAYAKTLTLQRPA